MPILILAGATGGAAPPEFITAPPVTFTAASAYAVTASTLFVAQSKPDYVTASVGFNAQSLPLGVHHGRKRVIYAAKVLGLPGPVLSWDYSHTADGEELNVVVAGLFGLATPQASLEADARYPDGSLIASLAKCTFSTFGQEPQEDVGAQRTTFRFKEDFNAQLRSDPLPELIPWIDNPSPDPCLRVRQKVSVGSVVGAALRGVPYSLSSDPLAGVYFEEGRTSFSTAGKSPADVWGATYGAIGMTLQSRGRRLIGDFPNPGSAGAGAVISDDWITEKTVGRELLQTPSKVTVRGGDFPTPLSPALILAQLGQDPGAAEVDRELQPNAEWIDPVESAGTARTVRGYLKSGGQMVSSIEITTDDIEVRETVDDKPFFKLWRGVATGYKQSRTTYDPTCPGRPMLEVTQSKTWGFDAQTRGGTFSTTGPGLYFNLAVGDLVSDETTTTTYRYSPQGYLAAKTTTTRRLASLKQENAEDNPQERGVLEAREYIKTTQTEQWVPVGGGRWLYTPGVSGQTLVPVYDAESGEAIRTASIARSVPDPPRVTDQAPPHYACDACDLKELLDPTGIVVSVGDAGFAEAQEISLDFLQPFALEGVARAALKDRWGRVVTSMTVPLPLGYLPGDWLSTGRVRETRISQAEGDVKIVTTLITVRPDDLLGGVGGLSVSDYTLDKASGRATMLAGKPGGALARVVLGWNAAAGTPNVENAFIAFRTGFPPRPGDEIEWKLVRGQREATSAR